MEYGVYVQHTSDSNIILVCLYVDDILLTWSYSDDISRFKKVLMNEFEITDLGNMKSFIGMEIFYSDKRFELMNCKFSITSDEINHKLDSDVEGDNVDATTFKQSVGSLRYLCNTIIDICYASGMVSRFMNKLKWSHYQAAVRILRFFIYITSYLAYELATGFEDQGEQACEVDD
ncbi:uncharacterized mitochondrial protein AtMg00810-like [Lathyrus oleraceus]|uniref:uncharacterized mitochondrial protein AtMg00810-like n=1 Tax=Pisum sativum TaxID=3888 RepID=UPI0021D265DC|nr:uncharacterized mitochondrial protein AtMg00810-like [Pisum sativum]